MSQTSFKLPYSSEIMLECPHPMPSFDVITIGSATQDVFVLSKKFEEVPDASAPDGLDACLPLGAKVSLDDIVFATGGGATNAAVTFSRFRLKTACLARVGKDTAGDDVIAQLKKDGVETRFVQRDPKLRTAYSIILVSGSGHRAILTYRGASTKLSSQEIPWKALSAKWVYLTSFAGDLKLLKDAFAFACRVGAKIAWNPGNGELKFGLKKLEHFLRNCDVLDVNREEASLLTEMPSNNLDAIIERLADLPKTALAITDGGKGAYIHTNGKTLFAPALKAKRVNTTGAGDAFGSGFVAALAKGLCADMALQVAMLNATGVVTHMGAKAGILKNMPAQRDIIRVVVK